MLLRGSRRGGATGDTARRSTILRRYYYMLCCYFRVAPFVGTLRLKNRWFEPPSTTGSSLQASVRPLISHSLGRVLMTLQREESHHKVLSGGHRGCPSEKSLTPQTTSEAANHTSARYSASAPTTVIASRMCERRSLTRRSSRRSASGSLRRNGRRESYAGQIRRSRRGPPCRKP